MGEDFVTQLNDARNLLDHAIDKLQTIAHDYRELSGDDNQNADVAMSTGRY